MLQGYVGVLLEKTQPRDVSGTPRETEGWRAPSGHPGVSTARGSGAANVPGKHSRTSPTWMSRERVC